MEMLRVKLGAQMGLAALHSLRDPDGLFLPLGGFGQGHLGSHTGLLHPSAWADIAQGFELPWRLSDLRW